jgi:trk system potassium uptake protein TrkH
MRLAPVFRALGNVQLLTSTAVLPSLAIAVIDDDGTALALAESFLILLLIGLAFFLPTRRSKDDLRLREGFLVTSCVWLIAGLVLAIPLVLVPPTLSYTDAVFEVISGLTTTGSTVIVGLDELPRSIRLYRQVLQFYGGMGIVVLAVAILPSLRIGGLQLTKGETTGPVKDAKLTPRIAQTAAALWIIYLGLNAACAAAYWLAGMSMFDALAHAFATVSTGGFGTYDANFGYFDSPVMEAIAIVFMLLGSASFALHYLAWHRGSMAPVAQDAEFRSLLKIVSIIALLCALQIWLAGTYPGFGESLRHSLFHTVSNITTTGFATTGFVGWAGFAPALMMLAGFIGGCAGSTSGGIKIVRIVIVAKLALREIMKLIHPRGRFLVKTGGVTVSDELVTSVAAFISIFVLGFLVFGMAIAATGADLITAFTAAATCITNMGPGLGLIAANFQALDPTAIWICSLAMLVGRLEVFTLIVILHPAFWRE